MATSGGVPYYSQSPTGPMGPALEGPIPGGGPQPQSAPYSPSYYGTPQASPAPITGGGVAPFLGQAQQQLANTIGGQFLNPQTNQYLQAYFNAAAQPMTQQFQNVTDPSILGGAVQSGNLYGSAPQQQESIAQTALAQGLGNLAANIYEPAYQAERGFQQQAIGMEPGIAQAQYLPAEMLGQVGQQQQQLKQALLSWPFQALSGAAGLIGPATGMSGSQISVGTNPQAGMK